MFVPLNNGNTCRMFIKYCWKDDPVLGRIVRVSQIWVMNKTCLYGTYLFVGDDFWQEVYDQIITYQATLNSSDPQYLPINVCPDGTVIATIEGFSCWALLDDDYIGYDFISPDAVRLVLCEGSELECKTSYTAC